MSPTNTKALSVEQIWNYYRDDLREVDVEIRNVLESRGNLIGEVGEYIINSGGKRLRPLLLIITSKLHGKCVPAEAMTPLATAVEFIHTASLLHDDVIDNADLRRGRKSARAVWSNRTSILVGDHLYVQGISIAASLKNHDVNATFLEACRSMTEGETLQLACNGNVDLLEEAYLQVIKFKTASLVSATCKLGAIVSEMEPYHQEGLGQFGLHLGTAYQIIDDTLDYIAEGSLFGKELCKDLKAGEITLPLLHTFSKCKQEEKEWIRNVFKAKGLSKNEVQHIVGLIKQYHSIEYCLDKARGEVEFAKKILERYPDSAHRQALYLIADYAISRNC